MGIRKRQESVFKKSGRKGARRLLRKLGSGSSAYFAKLAAKRKTFGGGRPKKKDEDDGVAEPLA